MEFIKKGVIVSKYLSDGCEFKKNNNNFRLISTVNEKYTPFIGETHNEGIWDMISSSDITNGEKFNNYYSLLLDHFKSGQTIFDKNADILLKKDERIIYVSYNNIRLNEAKSIRVTNSAHYRTSHRHGKRSYGVGVSKSRGESFEEVKNVDTGKIVITNKRFIFSGSKRSIDVNISQITGITAYSDGIKLQRKNKQKAEYFIGFDNQVFTQVFDNETYFFKMNGSIIKAMVEGGLNKIPQKSKLMIAKSQSSFKQIESKTKDFSKPKINLECEDKSNIKINFENKFNEVNLELSGDWEELDRNKKNRDLGFRKYIDSKICIIDINSGQIPDDLKVFESQLLDRLKDSYELVSYGHKIINDVDMFISTFIKNGDEFIFTYFNDGNIQYRILLYHKPGSNAKSYYDDLLNSVKILDKKDNLLGNSSATFCPSCGVTVSPNYKFCMECGTKINHNK